MRNAAVSFNNGNSFSLWAECSWHNFICQTASIKHLLAVNPQRHKPPEANVETLLLDISQSCFKLCCFCEFSNLLFFLLCIKTHVGPEVCMRKSGGKLDTHTTNYENVNCKWNVRRSATIRKPKYTPNLFLCTCSFATTQQQTRIERDLNHHPFGHWKTCCTSWDFFFWLNKTGFFLEWVSSIITRLYLHLQHCQNCHY